MKEYSKKIFPQGTPKSEEAEFTEEQVQQIKEILHLLAKTVSQVKIYPADHSTVKNFKDELLEILTTYLEKYWKLEIDIGEFSFGFKGQTVYHDPTPLKSLPFLFFKDGMQKLSFYRGLNDHQLQEFLELIKKYYRLPPEESDIVSLLWEKDFAHIRYFAPDDYLETKIGVGRQPIEIDVDTQAFKAGNIELSPEDIAVLSQRIPPEAVGREIEMREKTLDKVKEDEQIRISSLDEKDSLTLKSMLEKNRKISAEEELFLLVMEMLRLEEDVDRFSATLKVLVHNHKDIIKKGDFSLAATLLSDLDDFCLTFSSQSPDKVKLIHRFFHEARAKEHLDLIKSVLVEKEFSDYATFFEYIEILKPRLLLLGDLYEEIKGTDFRLKTVNYLKKLGKEDFSALMELAQEDRISLTKEIISILGSAEDKRMILLLANFLSYQNASIKKAAVESLGKVEDPSASKILIRFMADKDEKLRILATNNLQIYEDESVLKSMMQIVQDKSFMKKRTEEKQSLMDVLARSKMDRAYEFLQHMILKTGFFSRPKRIESSLCAIKALEKAGTPEAINILRKATKSSGKRMRQASRSALQKLSASKV